MMLDIILWKLPSPQGEFSVMGTSLQLWKSFNRKLNPLTGLL